MNVVGKKRGATALAEEGSPPGARRSAQKASTRARVLQVALTQLERDGFDATSIRGVAKEAGVSAGTVLLHFPDKRQLLHAALFEDLERTWSEARTTARHRSLQRDGERLAEAFFAYYAKRPVLSRALLRESLFADPPWSGRFAAQIAEVHAHVAALAGEAQARGELGPAAEPAVLGAVFFSFYYFALLAWLQGGHPEPARLFAKMWAQHLAGLAAAATPPATRRKQR